MARSWAVTASSARSEKTCVSRQRQPSQMWRGMVCSSRIPLSSTRTDAVFVGVARRIHDADPSWLKANRTAIRAAAVATPRPQASGWTA